MRKLGCITVLMGLLLFGVPLGVIAMDVSLKTNVRSGPAAVVFGIPGRMLQAYRLAESKVHTVVPRCKGLTWAVIAGVARIESNHASGHQIGADGALKSAIYGPRLTGAGVGGNTSLFPDTDGGRYDGDTSTERAVGPFQFIPATWEAHGRDANGDGKRDPQNIDDAALTAAVYLCGSGRNLSDPSQLRAAIYSYNQSSAYVGDVEGWIKRYSQMGAGEGAGTATGEAKKVIDAAFGERGVPYSWGGGSSSGPSTGICCSPGGRSGASVVGFDCSGLTQYAFAQVGLRLPRTAAAQARIGKRIPASGGVGALQPGDLVFFSYGADSTIYHVGIYLGSGRMINAPKPGTQVRVEAVWQDGFAGGARVV